MAKKVKTALLAGVDGVAGPVAVVEKPAAVVPVVTKKAAPTPIEESREALKHPLDVGQAFFESPEGYIVVAEASRDSVWCSKANNGKGMKINKRR